MAINAYVGLMGHGKSYQAILSVLVLNYVKGRRVVTNIEGINIEELKKYCKKNFPKVSEDKYGEIVIVRDTDIQSNTFYPKMVEGDNGIHTIVAGDFVKPGDIVLIDEAWKVYKQGFKYPPEHDEFFRKHRHYVNESGQSTDVCLITQDHTELNRHVKNLIEMLFVTRKTKVLSSKRYTLTIYEGNKEKGSAQINHTVHKFNPEVFPIYKSYAGSEGKETLIDDRVSIWKNKKLLAMLFVIPVCTIIFAVYMGHKTYVSVTSKIQAERDRHKKATSKVTGEASKQAGANVSPDSSSPQPASPPHAHSVITGMMVSKNRMLVVVKDEKNVVRVVNNPNCYGSGQFISCKIDNEMITYYK